MAKIYCKLDTCSKPHRARGYCSTHYATYMRGTLGSSLSLGERISAGHKAKRRARTGARISAAKTGAKYIRRKTGPIKASTSGEKHWNWKGGITSESLNQREQFKRQVHHLILARDNYTCQICQDDSSGQFHVDHIKSWSEFPELRFEMTNCRTLCRQCHYYITFKKKMPKMSKWGLYGVNRNPV